MKLYETRHLLMQLVRRDLAARYRGSLFGLLWMLMTPLLMLAVYSFVFGVVFKAKWGMQTEGQVIPFALLLYSGLILHGLMAEILPRAVTLLRSNPSYIKKVVFPVEILPLMSVISAISLFVIQWGLLLAACIYCGIYPTIHWLWLPVILLPFFILLLGLGWIVSALGVFLPDLQHVMGLLVTVLLFMSPIFYPLERLPEIWQSALLLNPLTYIVEAMRMTMFYAHSPDALSLGVFWLISVVMAGGGLAFFRQVKTAFADTV